MKAIIVAVVFFLCSAAYADESHVEKSFNDFCKEWMSILKKNKPNSKFCREEKGCYIAEYSFLSDEHMTTVKKTANKKTPYIGILKYREKVFKNQAATRERALAGPFTAASERNVTELFVFQNGKWQW